MGLRPTSIPRTCSLDSLSIAAGGLELMFRTPRLIAHTSVMTRLVMVRRTSWGRSVQSVTMASWIETRRA